MFLVEFKGLLSKENEISSTDYAGFERLKDISQTCKHL